MKYENILKNLEFEGFRAKVKVTVVIFKKKKNIVIALVPFIYKLILILYHTDV